ncbi:MAG: hypothetical protein ROM54_11580 [Anaerobiospirillum sp.]|nr:hypothetical protein [Anaerobiospirillum sp.]
MTCIHFTDFIYLEQPDLLYILEQRNSDYVRCTMDNDQIIEPEEHLRFCARLKERSDLKYFYIIVDDQPFGVCDFRATQDDWSEAEDGYYTFGDQALSMEKVCSIAILWLCENFKLHSMRARIKNDNKRALLPVYLKPHPNLRILDKDEHYTYIQTRFELEQWRTYVHSFLRAHQARAYFNGELFIDGTQDLNLR